MKNRTLKTKLLLCIILFISQLGMSQNNISGFIIDSKTGENLTAATIYNKTLKQGTFTNKYGFFSIECQSNSDTLLVSFVGYKSQQIIINSNQNSFLKILLKSNIELDEVVVKADYIRKILSSSQMGQNTLTSKQLKTIPVILGESDLMKAVQMLPGVTSAEESTSGISVRGGSPDQTLILLDDVPVYNVNHLFGYFSIFNTEAIKEVNLTKGGIPAHYGGRLSSVLDITMKEGNLNKTNANVQLGTLSSKATIEGPITQEKGSYMFSARLTWPDLPLRLYYELTQATMKTTYGFYDINGKINWKFSDQDRIYLSFYTGKDQYKYLNSNYNNRDEFKLGWGNLTASLRWNHIYSNKLFSNSTAYFSKFQFHETSEFSFINETIEKLDFYNRFSSKLYDACIKTDFDYYHTNKHHVKFGANASYKMFSPNETYTVTEKDSFELVSAKKITGAILETYIEDQFYLGKKIQINAGLRSSSLVQSNYTKFHILPRLAISWKPFNNISFKASYSKMNQHVNQLTNHSFAFAPDLWVLSTPDVPSSTSNLFSIGSYFVANDEFVFSVESYYSHMNNVISFYPGLDYTYLDGNNWESLIVQGTGKAYGIEFMLEKKKGTLTGFVSYTLSRSLRSYENIINGKYFPYDYDRPTKITAVLNYYFKDFKHNKYRKSINTSFTYSSGRLLSFSTANYDPISPSTTNFNTILEYGKVPVFYSNTPNNTRMNSFHHLDISFSLESKAKMKSSWTFGIYNIYNHFNASHYQIDDGKVYEVSLFPTTPFVSWGIRF